VGNLIALRDKRAEGGVPSRPHLTIVNLDENTSLSRAFLAIRACAARGPIHTALILCHGFEGMNFVD